MAERFLISLQVYVDSRGSASDRNPPVGFLLETDFDQHQRVCEVPTPVDCPFPGERIKPGLRGLSVVGAPGAERVLVAAWNRVHVIDLGSFEPVAWFDHPMMADLHGIHADERGLWLTSSLIDAVLEMDAPDLGSLDTQAGTRHAGVGVATPARLDVALRRALCLPETDLYHPEHAGTIDRDADHRLRGKAERGFQWFHANHVTPPHPPHPSHDDGRSMLVTGRGLGARNGKVLRLDTRTLEPEVWIDGLLGPHDGLWSAPDRFALTETDASRVVVYDTAPKTPAIAAKLPLPKTDESYWTRGLALDAEGNFLVGRSVWEGGDWDAAVVRMDQRGGVVDWHTIDIPGYRETRVFQIISAPSRCDAGE